MVTAGHDCGLVVVEEVFADRAYMPDGQLAPRSRPDAMIHDPHEALAHCLRMLGEGIIVTLDGSKLKTAGRSICVHGDEPSALAMVQHLKSGLEVAGMRPATLPELVAAQAQLSSPSGLKTRLAELIQYRWPVGWGRRGKHGQDENRRRHNVLRYGS